jgi:hypothetical protein
MKIIITILFVLQTFFAHAEVPSKKQQRQARRIERKIARAEALKHHRETKHKLNMRDKAAIGGIILVFVLLSSQHTDAWGN